MRRNLGPKRRGTHAQVRSGPALARDEQRLSDSKLAEHAGELGETPADDHAGRCSRAKETNARATRVSLRPLPRARKISRTGSSPRTRAVATRPAARSASIARREMNAMPCPAT